LTPRLTWHWLPRFAAVVGLFALCGLWPTVGLAEQGYAARVTRVFDGDTVWVKPQAGGPYRKLRLLGIDAPEICQRGGETARDRLAARVLRQVVWVEEGAADTYGRGLARLQHQGDDINRWLVVSGQAWAYEWRVGEGPYAGAQKQAKRARRGVFAQANAETPRDFRRRHGPCPLPAKPGTADSTAR